MPNWCQNRLIIRGYNTEDIEKFKKFFENKDGEFEFSFNKVIPFPEELKGISFPVNIVSQEEYEEQQKNPNSSPNPRSKYNKPITKDMSNNLIKKYNYNNWYDWSNANWGTKWDIINDRLAFNYNEDSYNIILLFQTAWSPPVPVIEKLKKMFTKISFSGIFIGENHEFSGEF